jgi:hypothetical protein
MDRVNPVAVDLQFERRCSDDIDPIAGSNREFS